jgi:hypothetical protein
MWINNETVRQIEHVARFRYIGRDECALWNGHRRNGELRLLSGWEWLEKNGERHQQGLKTLTAAYRDAYYVLIHERGLPTIRTLRLVKGSKR